MNDTIFDKILRKELPSTPVYEDENVYAFKDIHPKAPVHVLVIPKVKIERFSNLEDQEIELTGKFMRSVSVAARELGLNKNGYRIIFNNGEDGCQDVEYLHAHILGGKKLSFQDL